MNVIALETATDVCGVALLQGTVVTVELTLSRPRAHAENLMPLVRDALAYGGIPAGGLDAVAVSMGPGSYTGLRIGASTAKGLAVALDAALIGIPTLQALAASAAPAASPGDVIYALLNARREEVYAAAFVVGENRSLSPVLETAALHADELAGAWLPPDGSTLWLAGDGSGQAAPPLRRAFGDAVRVPGAAFSPSAGWIARLALPLLQQGSAVDPATFEPFYLKDFVAKKRDRSIFERLPF